MQVVILAGGYGTRLSEYTDTIPKPLVEIGGKPIIVHIIEHYISFGYFRFIIAGGYKCFYLKKYLRDYFSLSGDLIIRPGLGTFTSSNLYPNELEIKVVDTGLDSLTARRLNLLLPHIDSDNFFLTYGDGVSDVNLLNLFDHHLKSACSLTLTAVRPPARFGDLQIDQDTSSLIGFSEKHHLSSSWINGGFMVLSKSFSAYLSSDNEMLEREPIIRAVNNSDVSAFFHDGFWQCMDSKRDKDYLESLSSQDPLPWRRKY